MVMWVKLSQGYIHGSTRRGSCVSLGYINIYLDIIPGDKRIETSF